MFGSEQYCLTWLAGEGPGYRMMRHRPMAAPDRWASMTMSHMLRMMPYLKLYYAAVSRSSMSGLQQVFLFAEILVHNATRAGHRNKASAADSAGLVLQSAP